MKTFFAIISIIISGFICYLLKLENNSLIIAVNLAAGGLGYLVSALIIDIRKDRQNQKQFENEKLLSAMDDNLQDCPYCAGKIGSHTHGCVAE